MSTYHGPPDQQLQWWEMPLPVETPQNLPLKTKKLADSKWASPTVPASLSKPAPATTSRLVTEARMPGPSPSSDVTMETLTFSLSDISMGGLTPSSPHGQKVPFSFTVDWTAQLDDDGDIIMNDMVDEELVDRVTQFINEERKEPAFNNSIPPSPITTGERDKVATWVLVVDTNFLISQLKMVDELVKARPIGGHVVVIPWAVIQELDALKNKKGAVLSDLSDLSSSMGESRWANNRDVGYRAREANKWVYKAFASLEPGVWGQRKDEAIDTKLAHDDAILDCCRYFHEKKGFNTAIVSNDYNLCIKALLYDVKSISWMPQGATERMTVPKILSMLASQSGQKTNDEHARLASTQTGQAHLDHKSSGLETMTRKAPRSSKQENDVEIDLDAYLSPGQGLQASRYAPGNSDFYDEPMPKKKSGYRPLNAHPSQVLHPTAAPFLPASHQKSFNGTVGQHNDIKIAPMDVIQTKENVKRLLEKMETEILRYIPQLLSEKSLEKLGESYIQHYLGHKPSESLNSFQDIEDFVADAWMCEVLPKGKESVYKSKQLSSTWKAWYNWATDSSGAPPRAPPSTKELNGWIEEWDLLWKRSLKNNSETAVNFETTSAWREEIMRLGFPS